MMQIWSNRQSVRDYRSLKEDDVLFKTYFYQDGKGQEKIYYKKDSVEISLPSFTVTPEADNYEEVMNMMKMHNSEKIAALGNRYFYEIGEIMNDYYDGKISSDDVKSIFKEYVYHTFGTPSAEGTNCPMSTYQKSQLTRWLAGLYEHFSRANTRSACTKNMQEGKALMEETGMEWKGTYYYNSDWYYACEEMQTLFRNMVNELTEEYGAEQVDFKYVEANTKFTLDGGITFNGVWDSMEWQINYTAKYTGSVLDKDMVPPRGFVYCSKLHWDKETSLEGLKGHYDDKGGESSLRMFLLAAVTNTWEEKSLLLDTSNYEYSSKWETNENYQKTLAFVKNFNINWCIRTNRFEFVMLK